MFKETELKVQSMIKIVQCHVPVCYVSSHAALVHNVSYFTSACFSGFRSNCCSVSVLGVLEKTFTLVHN